MLFALQIIFWVSTVLLLYHYAAYPAILWVIYRFRGQDKDAKKIEHFPAFSIIIPAHNEESCIADKLISIINSDLSGCTFEVLVGSDNSTDATNAIVFEFASKHSFIQFYPYSERQGKIGMVEKLVARTKYDILIHTDANVLFETDCIKRLIAAFSDPTLGVIGANIVNTDISKDGISVQEASYVNIENRIKYWEGAIFDSMMGAFGGCFAMRKSLMKAIPKNFIVDDFYLTFQCMVQGFASRYDLSAICFEDVSNDWREEFRRKVRIGIGNYQNLRFFRTWAFRPFHPIGYCFISHKVLRWIGWTFILMAICSAFYLSFYVPFFAIISAGIIGVLFIVLVDPMLAKMGIHIKVFRYIFHFFTMNVALAVAFFKYISGVKTNIWTPTKRHQLNS